MQMLLIGPVAPFGRIEATMSFARSSCQLLCLFLTIAALTGTGCARKPLAAPDTAPPTVTVAKPVEREVTDHVEFTGRTDAVISTDIRPRVRGYLVGMPFKEGAEVKKDDVLF